MPPNLSNLTLNYEHGVITLEEPRFNTVTAAASQYPFDAIENAGIYPYTLEISSNDYASVSAEHMDAGMEKLAQTVKRLGISADELAELLTQLGSIEEIEQSEELAEFLKGFSADDQEVI